MAQESAVATQVYAALAEHLKRPVSAIRPQDDLRTSLGLNSLDIIELLFKLEERFDLEIPDADLADLRTVGHVIAYIERHARSSPGVATSFTAATARPDVDEPGQAPEPEGRGHSTS